MQRRMRHDTHRRRRHGWIDLVVPAFTVTALLGTAGVPPVEAQVGSWAVTGRVKAIACFDGRCVQELGPRTTGVVEIFADGTYRSPSAGDSCVGDAPEEIGTWEQKGKKIFFEPENVDDIVTAVEGCFDGVGIDVRRYRSKAKLKRGGALLRGKSKLSGRVRVRGRSVAVTGVARWEGTPIVDGTSGAQRPRPDGALLPAMLGTLGGAAAR